MSIFEENNQVFGAKLVVFEIKGSKLRRTNIQVQILTSPHITTPLYIRGSMREVIEPIKKGKERSLTGVMPLEPVIPGVISRGIGYFMYLYFVNNYISISYRIRV